MSFAESLNVKDLTKLFKQKIDELQDEPEFQWTEQKTRYAVDEDGTPSVKLVLGNVPLDYDLWKGLRNPAMIGLHPAGLEELWEFYASKRRERVDESGRQTIFQLPRSFDFALKNYHRAVVISMMLPFSPRILGEYVENILSKRGGSSHLFSKMYESLNLMADKTTTRAAIDLVSDDNAVIAMYDNNVRNVSTEAIPQTRQGDSHGPSKGGNYPQKSLAVLMGLGQFGVSRIVMRDELSRGMVRRFIGPIRSIIVFDKEALVRDGSGGLVYPTEDWRSFLVNLFDFTNVNPEINRYRFCSYIPYGDEGCRMCVVNCPSGAQANSVPAPDGRYPEHVSRQVHRFWDGKLQFDFSRCCEKRGQMANLYPEWSCARCVTTCAAKGTRRLEAAEGYYEKTLDLTSNSHN